MESIKWENIKKSQRKTLFNKYIEFKLEENEKKFKNEIINMLIYTKNRFILKILKKDEYYKKINEEEVIINNNMIDTIKTLETTEDGLFYISTNKQKKNYYKTNNKILVL